MKNVLKAIALGTVTMAALNAEAKITCAVQAETEKLTFTTVLAQSDMALGQGAPLLIEKDRVFVASIDDRGTVTLAVTKYDSSPVAFATGHIQSGWVQLMIPGYSLSCRKI